MEMSMGCSLVNDCERTGALCSPTPGGERDRVESTQRGG
jgi:hypothetical protein